MTTENGPQESIGDGSAPYKGWPADVRATDAAQGHRKKIKRGRRKPPPSPHISLTSLTDMVTVLLVYLLKTFATNPIEVKDSSIELPRSTCNPVDVHVAPDVALERSKGTPPRGGCGEAKETTIVLISGPTKKETVNGFSVSRPNTPKIAVNSDAVVDLDPATYRVPDDKKDPASNGWIIAPLRDALKQARQLKEVTAAHEGKKFDGMVVILADRQTPYRVLSEVLVTCGEAGYGDFRFAVIKPD